MLLMFVHESCMSQETLVDVNNGTILTMNNIALYVSKAFVGLFANVIPDRHLNMNIDMN